MGILDNKYEMLSGFGAVRWNYKHKSVIRVTVKFCRSYCIDNLSDFGSIILYIGIIILNSNAKKSSDKTHRRFGNRFDQPDFKVDWRETKKY